MIEQTNERTNERANKRTNEQTKKAKSIVAKCDRHRENKAIVRIKQSPEQTEQSAF
jgi:hypothetical protein